MNSKPFHVPGTPLDQPALPHRRGCWKKKFSDKGPALLYRRAGGIDAIEANTVGATIARVVRLAVLHEADLDFDVARFRFVVADTHTRLDLFGHMDAPSVERFDLSRTHE